MPCAAAALAVDVPCHRAGSVRQDALRPSRVTAGLPSSPSRATAGLPSSALFLTTHRPRRATGASSPRRRWLRAGLIACLFIGGLMLFRGAPSSVPLAQNEVASAPVEPHAEYATTEIQDLRVGDTVLAMDLETGEVAPRRIVDAFRRTSYRLRVLTLRSPDGQALPPIRTTDEHPFWVIDAEDFVPAGELQPGDELLGPNGEVQTLATTESEEHPEGVAVYNFEVEGAHTYFILPGQHEALHGAPLLVHNAAAGACRMPSFKKPRGAGDKKGSYTIKFESGMKYHGKGPWSRALASARRILERFGDMPTKVNWKAAKVDTDRQAFIDEALRIRRDGGIASELNYNQINSPGAKSLPSKP
ncbi:MAG: polymorphic toxin-type HINT domain-containing protein [Planctomycetia bacterium]|nr:polymorphic toxin-type HINT domain-containing protein [Planctomycetia bacterium]